VIIRVKDVSKDYSCYITHRSRSDIVFVSNVRKKHLDAILLALCNTLRCGEWKDIKLSGRDLQSLVDLTHNKHCQVSMYRVSFGGGGRRWEGAFALPSQILAPL